VSGSDASCAVTVTKMRVWYRDAEVETRLQSWVEWQLRGLMKGVQEEAAEPSIPEHPTAPGPRT